MLVVLDAFSGRPNPTWEIPEDKAATFLRRISSLPVSQAALSVPDLGYRGFVINSDSSIIRVYRGQVTVTRDGRIQTFQDNNGIEKDLATEARAKGYGAILG